MNMNEISNMIEILQAIGWTDSQITNFQLGIEGRRDIETAARIHKEIEDESDD